MNFLKNSINQLKLYARTPEFFALWVLLGLIIALITVSAYFLPGLLTILVVVSYCGIAIAVINGYLKLATLRVDSGFKNRELEAVIQNLKEGVIVYDTDFKILNMNRGAEEILSTNAKEVIGTYISPASAKETKLRALSQVIFPSLAVVANQISEGEWPQIVDLELENPRILLRTTLNKITDVSGRVIGFLRLITDQTREIGVVESKTEFITVAAHQLRTPLTAIKWSFETISKELVDKPELQQAANDGLDLSMRSLKIVNDLLSAAKIEEGKFGYLFEDVDLNKFINDLLSGLKVLSEEYGIKINFSSPKKVLKIKADPEKLETALLNILDNAIRYNSRGGSVTVSLEESSASSVKITISDTGVGIPESDMPKLFDKFFRGQNVVQLEPNGSGLGLYITQNIIKKHGGEISIESNPGRGTVFFIDIPKSE
ncbi:MAG: ATP-binding protein [Patescibacteria group bacterium]